jgi:DNA-binding transcriptional LysR family regulator
MNLARLEAFVAVCDAGSFTQAAARLGLTKSAASQHVAALEAELGTPLLQRSTRRLALTDAGTTLLEDARALLAQAARVGERARGAAAELSGLLRLTSAMDLAPLVAPLLAEYTRLHPRMRIEYLPTDRLVDLVAEGVDLSLRSTLRRDSSLRAAPLDSFEVWAVASPDYLARHGTPRRLADLTQHAWIAFTLLPSPWTLRTRDGKRAVRLSGTLATSSSGAGRELAIAGAGIYAAPRFALDREVAAGRLVRVLSGVKLPEVALYAAWPGRLEPAAKIRAFIELAKSRLRRQPPASAAQNVPG